MKDLKKILFIALAGWSLFSCSDNEVITPENGAGDEIKDPVYMSFALDAPGSRGATDSEADDSYGSSSDGTEAGTTAENQINRITIVLTTADKNTYITHSYAEIGDENMIQSTDDWYVVKFSAQDLNAYAGEDIHVFVFCNQAKDLVAVRNNWNVDQTFGLADAADVIPWGATGLYMSNAQAISSTKKTLPTLEGWDLHKTPANPYSLGEIRVERSVARFDIKPGGDEEGTHKYYVKIDTDGAQASDDDDKLATITLTDVALINQQKSAYMVRRVSDDGLNSDVVLGGTEWFVPATATTTATGNFVVDVQATAKQAYPAADNTALHGTFLYHMTAPETWAWTSLATLTQDDNAINPTDIDGYKRWRYAMENTIPAVSETDLTSGQQKGITTGVVFKGKLELKSDIDATAYANLKAAFANKKLLFVFENQLLGDFSMVQAKATAKDANGEFLWPNLAAAYNCVNWLTYFSGKGVTDHGLTANPGGTYAVETPGNADFTVYTYDETYEGYPVYYYYWNRHNDNGNNGVMGIMEFGVVRNNVYKLMVDGINLYGHPYPSDPDDPDDPGREDPDPENPDEPDEEDNLYLKVLVKVVPWVIRVNNIVF